jgi:hypothetical protein
MHPDTAPIPIGWPLEKLPSELIFLGPRCDYHPDLKRSVTGLSWPDLAKRREQMITTLQENAKRSGFGPLAYPRFLTSTEEANVLNRLQKLKRKANPIKK